MSTSSNSGAVGWAAVSGLGMHAVYLGGVFLAITVAFATSLAAEATWFGGSNSAASCRSAQRPSAGPDRLAAAFVVLGRRPVVGHERVGAAATVQQVVVMRMRVERVVIVRHGDPPVARDWARIRPPPWVG